MPGPLGGCTQLASATPASLRPRLGPGVTTSSCPVIGTMTEAGTWLGTCFQMPCDGTEGRRNAAVVEGERNSSKARGTRCLGLKAGDTALLLAKGSCMSDRLGQEAC